MNEILCSEDAKKHKVCPVCAENVEARGLRATFKAEGFYPLCVTFCSWSHYTQFKVSNGLETV